MVKSVFPVSAAAAFLVAGGLCLIPARADVSVGCDAATTPSAMRVYVCSQESLRREMEGINQRYLQITRNPDPDVQFLAGWDRIFFVLSLNNCQNAHPVEVCASKHVSDKALMLSLPVSRDMMLNHIKDQGILSPEIVARYPEYLTGVAAEFPGEVKLHRDGAALRGHFRSYDGHESWPVVMPDAPEGELSYYSANPEVTGWFDGHMEVRDGTLTLVLDPDPRDR